MKKLELKNLKVKKLTSDEKSNVNGGGERTCHNSGLDSCNYTSAAPIRCFSEMWKCNYTLI